MTRARRAAELLLPWSGLLGGFLGWALTHQLGSNLAFDHCPAMQPGVIILIALLGLILAIGGGLLSLRHWRRGGAGGGSRHFVSATGMMAASLFSIAILWQTIGSLTIPRCFA